MNRIFLFLIFCFRLAAWLKLLLQETMPNVKLTLKTYELKEVEIKREPRLGT
jgi:hypothetical protein